MAQRIGALIPLDEAMARMRARVAPVPVEHVEPIRAGSAIAAEDCIADGDRPAVPVASRDGWAVSAAETVGASPLAPAPLSTEPVQVSTGDPLPPGMDAVLPFGVLGRGALGVEALETVAVGEGVLAQGAEMRAGTRLLAAGQRLSPFTAAALIAAGIETIAVRRPRLTIVTTKREARATSGLAMLSGSPGDRGAAAPALTREALAVLLRSSLDRVDALIVFGGTGEGADDWTVDVLAEAGDVLFHGVALEPGSTAAVAIVAGKPILAVPRHPPAALAVLETLGAALLDALNGAVPAQAPRRTGVLTRKLSARAGLTRLVYVRADGGDVVPLGGGDAPSFLLADANGYVVVPPTSEGYAAGATVQVRPFTALEFATP